MITSRALPVVLAIEPKMVDLGYFEHIFITHVLFFCFFETEGQSTDAKP